MPHSFGPSPLPSLPASPLVILAGPPLNGLIYQCIVGAVGVEVGVAGHILRSGVQMQHVLVHRRQQHRRLQPFIPPCTE